MGDYGNMIEEMMWRLAVCCFLAGMAAVGIGWLLWHFVLSHIAWR